MPTVYSKPQRTIRKNPNHARISRFQNSSPQQRQKRFETVKIAVRQNFFSTRVSVQLDSTSYELIETLYNFVTGMKHIDIYKNKILLTSELCAAKQDILSEQVKKLLDRYVNRPGTVIKEFSLTYHSYNIYFPRLPLFEHLQPEHLQIGTFSFRTNFGDVDLSLVDFINISNPRKTYLMISNPHLTGRLLNLSRQHYQIYEERILEILFLAHCHRFISEDFPVGSSYHASEKFRHLVPNNVLQSIVSTFSNSEKVSYSKLCKTPFVTSNIPLRVTIPFGNEKILEIYNDDCNYVAVVAEQPRVERLQPQALITRQWVAFFIASIFLSAFILPILLCKIGS